MRLVVVVGLIALSACSSGTSSLPPPSGGGHEGEPRIKSASSIKAYAVVTSFQSGNIHHPLANVTFDSSGNIYGTGMDGTSPDVYGGIFKIDPHGNESDLYAFTGSNVTQPEADVVTVPGGGLIGTTIDGVYSLSSSGSEKVIKLLSGGPEGGYSFSNLIEDKQGNYWGTASEGGYFLGKCKQIYVGCGVVFRVSASGRYSVVHKFRYIDGASPAAGLALGPDGNFYGTTTFGGSIGWGEVFRITSAGKVTVLYNFQKGPDGDQPVAGVTLDSHGNIYGTTQYGGFAGNQTCNNGCGVVFKLSGTGQETVLHQFSSIPDGAFPLAAVYLENDSTLFGTTQQGGTGTGTIFELNTSGKAYHVLHEFTDGPDGGFPAAALVPDNQGNLYGTTEYGGIGGGTVFRFRP
ncbi:MAG: hypothetical protein JOZ77_12620 [Candidatus Eremiobacteraeota bacterium]|nr:hypothetical protein [Candidatus Eremiobacteraeota bacterium]